METVEERNRSHGRITKARWAIAAIVTSLPLGILGYLAQGYGKRYCAVMKAANALKDAKDKIAPLDCAEFWLNRYQATFATLASIAIAIYVIRPAIRQLAEMRRQSSSEARQVIRDRISDLTNELAALDRLMSSLESYEMILKSKKALESFSQIFQKAASDFDNAIEIIIKSAGPRPRDVSFGLGDRRREILIRSAYSAQTTAKWQIVDGIERIEDFYKNMKDVEFYYFELRKTIIDSLQISFDDLASIELIIIEKKR